MQLAGARLRARQAGARDAVVAQAKFRPQSRIGKQPVIIPEAVKADLKDASLTVKGPKGELSMVFNPLVTAVLEDNVIRVSRNADTKAASAMHGMSRAICANLVEGVNEGFSRQLELRGVGYRAAVSGDELTLTLGFSHPVVIKMPEGITASVKNSTVVTLEGADKEILGNLAAVIRSKRPPEPYKGKGVRYVGERVVMKAGKSGKA